MANKIKMLYDQGKALMAPDESIDPSLMAKKQNVDQYKDSENQKPSLVISAPAPISSKYMLNKGPYGSKPGEQRIDTSSMIKPLGADGGKQEHLAEEQDLHPNMVAFHAEGGQLDKDKINIVGENGPEEIVGDEVTPLYHTNERGQDPFKGEEEGAPADASGRVLSNPEHKRAMWDTERPNTEQKAPMSTDNATGAPAGEPAQIQTMSSKPSPAIPMPVTSPNKAAADAFVQGLPGTATPEARSKAIDVPNDGMMKPKSSTLEAMDQRSAEARRAQMAEPTPAAPDPNQVIADQHAKTMKAKLDAASKGDLVGMGAAIIAGNALPKPEDQIPSPEQGGVVPDVNLAPGGTATPAYTGKARIGGGTPGEAQAGQDYKNKIADLDNRILTASQIHTPEGKEELGYLQSEKAVLQKMNPLGSAANKPGVLGKIEHGLGEVGNVVGNALMPNVMPSIPGSQANLAAKNAEGQANVAAGEKSALEEAQADKESRIAPASGKALESQVYASLTQPDASGKLPINPETSKPYTPQEAKLAAQRENNDERFIESEMQAVNPATGQLNTRGDAMSKLAQMKAAAKPEHSSDEQKALEQYYKDHPELTKSLENDNKALQERAIAKQAPPQALGITPEGQATAVRPGAAVSPGTTTLGQQAKEDSKWYTYLDDKGQMQYGQGKTLPEGAQRTEVDPKTFMNEAKTANTVQQALNNLAKDVHEHPELWDNAEARNILATTLEQVDREAASMLVAGTGGSIPLPSGLGSMINTALQNKALDEKTSRALKDYISDYKSAKDQGIVMQMALQGGKIGRGSQQAFKAIIDQFPNGSTPDSTEAKRQMGLLQKKQDVLSSKYPDKYQDYSKEKPYTPSNKTGEVPAGATHVYKDKAGNIAGYAVNGQYQAVQ